MKDVLIAFIIIGSIGFLLTIDLFVQVVKEDRLYEWERARSRRKCKLVGIGAGCFALVNFSTGQLMIEFSYSMGDWRVTLISLLGIFAVTVAILCTVILAPFLRSSR